MHSVAAGQNSTLFLVSPSPINSPSFSDLPRYPSETPALDECIICHSADGDPLACDRCDRASHIQCLSPPLKDVPEGEWFCNVCVADPGGLLGFEGEEVGDGVGEADREVDEMEVRNNRKRKGGNGREGNGKRKKD